MISTNPKLLKKIKLKLYTKTITDMVLTDTSQQLHMGYSGKSCWQEFTNKFAYCYLDDSDRMSVYSILNQQMSVVEFCRMNLSD